MITQVIMFGHPTRLELTGNRLFLSSDVLDVEAHRPINEWEIISIKTVGIPHDKVYTYIDRIDLVITRLGATTDKKRTRINPFDLPPDLDLSEDCLQLVKMEQSEKIRIALTCGTVHYDKIDEIALEISRSFAQWKAQSLIEIAEQTDTNEQFTKTVYELISSCLF